MTLAERIAEVRTWPAALDRIEHNQRRTADLLAELHREIAALRRDVTGLRGDLDRAKTGDNE